MKEEVHGISLAKLQQKYHILHNNISLRYEAFFMHFENILFFFSFWRLPQRDSNPCWNLPTPQNSSLPKRTCWKSITVPLFLVSRTWTKLALTSFSPSSLTAAEVHQKSRGSAARPNATNHEGLNWARITRMMLLMKTNHYLSPQSFNLKSKRHLVLLRWPLRTLEKAITSRKTPITPSCAQSTGSFK